MERIETMYFKMISAITGAIKQELNITTQGALRLGSCNGVYTESTFQVPIQKIYRTSMTTSIIQAIEDLPICFLGIIKAIDIEYNIKNGDTFGEAYINIEVKITKTNEKYLKVKTDYPKLLEVVSEFAGEKISVTFNES